MAPEVHPGQVDAACTHLRAQAIPAPDESKTQLTSVNHLQNAATWGTESGPAAFRGAFQGFLADAENQLSLLHTKLSEYEQALVAAKDAFMATDADAAAVQTIHQERAETDVVVQQQEQQLAAQQQSSASGPGGTSAATGDPNAPTGDPTASSGGETAPAGEGSSSYDDVPPTPTPGSGPVPTSEPSTTEGE